MGKPRTAVVAMRALCCALMTILASLWAVPAMADLAPAGGAPHLAMQLVPESDSPRAGQALTIAIATQPEKGWHGYWRNPTETERVLKDGWLHTGDIGEFDDAGRLRITDRKKDLIINDKGENVAPQKVEGMLTLQPEIAQAMIAGDRRPYMVALIVPDSEWTAEWCAKSGTGCNRVALDDDLDFRAAISAAIDRVNRDLSVTERIRRFIIAHEPFSIENQQLTPSLKIRRHVLREVYGERLDALYKN